MNRRLAVGSALGAELAIEVVEEGRGGPHDPALVAHSDRVCSAASTRCSTRSGTFARKPGGTVERSVTTLAAKTSSCSAGVMFSSSAAVTIDEVGLHVRWFSGSTSTRWEVLDGLYLELAAGQPARAFVNGRRASISSKPW